MAPSRRRGTSKAAAAAAATLREWKVGDLVLAKVKGFPAWPATVSDPKKWGYATDWKKVLVYFFGTQQIAFCNPGDVEAFTEEKKESLLGKRHGKGADFVRAVQEIIESSEKLKQQNPIDEIKVEKVSHGDTNSEESSPEVLAKDLSRFPSQTSIHQLKCVDTKVKLGEEEPSLNRKDAVDVAQNEDIEYRKTSEEQIIDDVKEARPLSTYSLRRRSGGSRLESSTTKKRALSARRSRSSSRLHSSKVESSTLPCKDVEKFVGVSSSNSIMGGSGRRSRWTRRVVDVSKGDNLDSPSFSAYSSVEESASEILSMDSDDSHDDSAVESVSKHGRSEIGVEHAENKHVEGDFQLRKSLNLDIKTVVLKRKRKPNRKRLISDTVELASSNERELNFDASQSMVAPDSGVSSGNCPRENGDEHLPLVKRARVRMSKLSAAEAIRSYPELEEQLPSENLSNPPPLSCSPADHDINTSHPGAEAISQDVPSLETCLQCTDATLQVPKDVKNSQDGSTGSADVEAALPLSKRLHRALEAMSANATEPRPSSDEASLVVQMVTSECHLSPVRSSSSPQMDLDGKDTNVLGKQILDSLGSVNVAGGSVSLDSKNSPQTADDRMEDDDSRAVSRNTECEMPEKNVENGTEVINVLETPATACVIFHPEQVPSPGHLSVEENQSRSRKDEASVDEVFQGRDVLNATPDIELLNCDSEGTEKVPDTSKCSAISIDYVLKAEAIDTEMQIDQVEKSESSTEMINCTDIEHLRSHEDDCSQEICKHTLHDVQHQLAHKNGTHAFSNGHLSDREESAPLESTSLSDRAHSSQRASPPTASGCHLSTSASSRNSQSSGTASSAANSRYKRHEFEPSTVQPKSQDKLSSSDEAHATLSSFEAVLGGLTRTKESIGRATRIAIDCAKFGIATKVVDSLARALEREPSLYKRVDLFFLIDSIMQCSRGLKEEAGGMYISIVQSKLLRLLSAAAPPGHTAHENRRQCLKVLRLWLERRILPESILRHHIRELDVMNGSSSAGPYSRRSARTERAFDDPIREMEGMLVDEYGSNSSFQLPGFCMPRMRKDDDEGSESDESFEAVTPERPCDAPEDGIGAPIEKRGHILQDVDGELEMEDVAPPETEINDASTINTAPGSQSVEQQFQPPFAPPLQDIPPSSASLPLSSVPPPPPPFTSGLPSHLPNGVDQNAHRSAHDAPSNMAQHADVHHVAPRDDHRIHEPPPYHSPDFRDRQKQIPVPRNDGSYGRRPTNNFRENDGPWDHRGYPLRPPHHADQFPYVPSDQRFRSRRDPPPPSHSRYHSPHNRGNGGNHYNHHPERLKPPPHDVRENWRFSGPYSEPRYHDKARNFHPGPYDCPPYDHPSMPDHGWGYPPGPANYRNNVPFRPPYEAMQSGSHLDSFEQDPISGDHDESIALKRPSTDMIRSGLPIKELDGCGCGGLIPVNPSGNQLPANVRVGKQSYNNR